jgi:hypothetical protein
VHRVGRHLRLIKGYSGESAFPRIKEIAASIAGISPTLDPDFERQVTARLELEAERRRREDAEREQLRAAMPSAWTNYDRRSLGGERYLAGRGIDPTEVREIVRYSPRGYPALPLRDLASGDIVGIQYRHTEPGADPKCRTVKGSRVLSTALHGRLAELDREGVDIAVIVEGLADTLVGCLAFDGCAIYGAAGADQLEDIARIIAPRITEIGGWLLLVPHDDATGIENMRLAMRAAQSAGLALDRDLLLVDLGKHKDLADAWRAGWRWTWPNRNGGVA